MPNEPGPPIGLVTDETATFRADDDTMTLKFKWKEPIDDGGTTVIDYRIEMKTEATSWLELNGAYEFQSIVKTGLIPGTEYKFRVQARNSVGDGPVSEELVYLAGEVPGEPK